VICIFILVNSLDALSKKLIQSLGSWKVARFTSDMNSDELDSPQTIPSERGCAYSSN